MSNVELNFSREEYQQRLAKTRAAMEKAGVELLVVYDPSNKSWLTGYDGWSFYVHECVLLAMEGEPVYVGRGMDAVGATRTTFMAHDNIIGYPDYLVQNPPLHAMTWMAEEVLPARGWDKLRIGVEMDNYYFSARAYVSLCEALPQATLIDATGLVNWQRAIKSEQELIYMRRAARIVEKMHARVLELFERGYAKTISSPRFTTPASSVPTATAVTTLASCRYCPQGPMPVPPTSPGMTNPFAPMKALFLNWAAYTGATTARYHARFTLAPHHKKCLMPSRRCWRMSKWALLRQSLGIAARTLPTPFLPP